ncbi:MAG TPA: fumarylacetoacetate hydrolase family protein [Candidatus Dormibacteraeota bacterium]|jgi:2-keto-4-pentenoate hydratase/2-oxohepta-3-ene-1,7-dioic acid hydratase in catechol pathway
MKVLMFREGNERRLGVIREGTEDVVDVSQLAKGNGSSAAPADVLALIESGEEGLKRLRDLVSSAKGSGDKGVVRQLKDLKLLSPLDPPRGNMLAIGRNYEKHAAESAKAWGEQVKPPTVFTKAQTSITGPYDEIPIDPAVSDKIDWEVELGVVIGKKGVNIKLGDAMNYVFGYTVVNDISARDIQNGWGGQFFKGKSLDASSPVGPWVVTKDEIPDVQNLRVSLRVNGVTKQDGNTRDMINSVEQLVAWLSVGMTLLPGSLIATGTPDGVGFARTPPEFLKAGDVLETEVEKVGLLRNKMVAAQVLAGR